MQSFLSSVFEREFAKCLQGVRHGLEASRSLLQRSGNLADAYSLAFVSVADGPLRVSRPIYLVSGDVLAVCRKRQVIGALYVLCRSEAPVVTSLESRFHLPPRR